MGSSYIDVITPMIESEVFGMDAIDLVGLCESETQEGNLVRITGVGPTKYLIPATTDGPAIRYLIKKRTNADDASSKSGWNEL